MFLDIFVEMLHPTICNVLFIPSTALIFHFHYLQMKTDLKDPDTTLNIKEIECKFNGYIQLKYPKILCVKLQWAKWGRDQISCKRATQAGGGKTQNTNWADTEENSKTRKTEGADTPTTASPDDVDYCLAI